MSSETPTQEQRTLPLPPKGTSRAEVIRFLRECYEYTGRTPYPYAFNLHIGQEMVDVYSDEYRMAGQFSCAVGVVNAAFGSPDDGNPHEAAARRTPGISVDDWQAIESGYMTEEPTPRAAYSARRQRMLRIGQAARAALYDPKQHSPYLQDAE